MTNLIEMTGAKASEDQRHDFVEALRKLAHTLSQPLTSLQGSAELALRGELNESECRQFLDVVFQESRRMGEILEALRDLLDLEDYGNETQVVSWTRTVEKLLEEGTHVHNNSCPQLVGEVMDEVWVKANQQHIDIATRKFVKGVTRARHVKRVVRVGLSALGETACLSLCAEDLASDVNPSPHKDEANFPSVTVEADNLDWWVVRHAIERHGGWLNISDVSRTCRCYRLNLPLAYSDVQCQA